MFGLKNNGSLDLMKQKFEIDIMKKSQSTLEALTILHGLDPNSGFHNSMNLRRPLGIYNISINRICNKIIKCCNKLEDYFKTSNKIRVLNEADALEQEIIDYLELSLYAAAEHVDDCYNDVFLACSLFTY